MQYKFSICITTYNRKKYLKYALDSIVNQLDDTIKIELKYALATMRRQIIRKSL